jgi:hypothetical protein
VVAFQYPARCDETRGRFDRAEANNRSVRVRATLVVLATSAVAVSAGCGPEDRATDAAAVAEGFHGALELGDAPDACAALAEDTRSKLEQQEQAPCEEAILELELPRGATAAETSVYVTTASVSLTEGGKTFLDESASGWKVSAAGCTRAASDLPYDCELEG